GDAVVITIACQFDVSHGWPYLVGDGAPAAKHLDLRGQIGLTAEMSFALRLRQIIRRMSIEVVQEGEERSSILRRDPLECVPIDPGRIFPPIIDRESPQAVPATVAENPYESAIPDELGDSEAAHVDQLKDRSTEHVATAQDLDGRDK